MTSPGWCLRLVVTSHPLNPEQLLKSWEDARPPRGLQPPCAPDAQTDGCRGSVRRPHTAASRARQHTDRCPEPLVLQWEKSLGHKQPPRPILWVTAGTASLILHTGIARESKGLNP